MGELNEDDVEANKPLLRAVASELLPAGNGGGSVEIVRVPFQLASRHKVMKLGDDDSARVHVVEVKGKPLMVLTTLLESVRVVCPENDPWTLPRPTRPARSPRL